MLIVSGMASHKISNLAILCSCFLFVFTQANLYTSEKCSKNDKGEEFCTKDSDDEGEDEPCFIEEAQESLFQWDPVEVCTYLR